MPQQDRDRLFAQLARRRGLSGAPATTEPPRRTATGPLPLLPAQRQLWFLDRVGASDGVYTISQSWRATGPVDVPALRGALGLVLDRHEALRARFVEVDGHPAQVVEPLGTAPPVTVVDVRDDADPAGRADEEAAAELARPFDLATAPLVRLLVVRYGHAEHLLVLTLHHIVADAASVGVVLEELARCYSDLVHGRTPTLPAPELRYGDYVAWQAELPTDADERYWRAQLAGAPALLTLPTDHPRPVAESFRGGGYRFVLSRALTARLRAFCREQGFTANAVLLAAFVMLLARQAGQDDVVVGCPVRDESVRGLAGGVGMFANTVAIRTRLTGDPTVAEVVAGVQSTTVDALEHQRCPWELVARSLAPDRHLSHNSGFQAMFVLNTAGVDFGLDSLDTTWLDQPVTTARFDLTLALALTPSVVEARIDHATDLFDTGTAAGLAEQYVRLLTAVLHDPSVRAADLDTTTERDAHLLRTGGHRTPPGSAPDRPAVHRAVARQAGRTPDAPAVVDDTGATTYADLVTGANGLAHALRRAGVRRGDLVALGVPASGPAVVGLLGILSAGAAYVPLDPGHPRPRLAALLAGVRPAALVTTHRHRAAFTDVNGPVVLVGDVEPAPDPPHVPVGPDDLAYVIHTSGSTGEAKRVGVRHGPLAGLADAFAREHGFGPGERVLFLPPLTFDASAGDIYAALTTGATLLPGRDPGELTGPGLLELCGRRHVTMVDAPSALWQRWTDDLTKAGATVGPPLRVMMVGGESVPVDAVRAWGRLTGGRVKLHNHYGPTEATVCATSYRTVDGIELGDRVQLPIGRPLPHVRCYVLDGGLRPVPAGAFGELCLGGDAPARGYLGRAAATADRFVPDPFTDRAGARMYRTGDLVRRAADGELEFAGRIDRQLKVRGHRIEPAEVEAACRARPDVTDAVVTARGDRLVAHLAGAVDLDATQVRAALRGSLPGHLVPDAIVLLAALPRTAHGKIDLAALPDPASSGPPFAAPEGPTEQAMADIWATVLDRERIGRHDDFFAVGGHSLVAGSVVARVRARFGVSVPVRTLFERSTLADFTAAVLRPPGPVAGAAPPDPFGDAVLTPQDCPPVSPERAAAAVDRAVRPEVVLLTGATGFLGGHLLAQLLRRTTAQVHCLVRARSVEEGARRIAAHLLVHALWDAASAARIVPVPGDLAEPRLGLTVEEFDALSATVDVIHHCGAATNLVRPYAQLWPANVRGTAEVLRLASRHRAIPVHHVSTLGVYRRDLPATVTETSPPDDPGTLSRGYELSKWVADRMVRAARAAGLPVTVHRPARISGDSRTGIGPATNLFGSALRTVVTVGSAAVDDRADEEDLAPVDHVAAAIVRLAGLPVGYGRDFHYRNAATTTFGEAVDVLRELGYPIGDTTADDWHAQVLAAAGDSTDPALSAVAAAAGGRGSRPQTVFDCRDTETVARLQYPPADAALLRRYVHHQIRTGHLPAPPGAAATAPVPTLRENA